MNPKITSTTNIKANTHHSASRFNHITLYSTQTYTTGDRKESGKRGCSVTSDGKCIEPSLIVPSANEYVRIQEDFTANTPLDKEKFRQANGGSRRKNFHMLNSQERITCECGFQTKYVQSQKHIDLLERLHKKVCSGAENNFGGAYGEINKEDENKIEKIKKNENKKRKKKRKRKKKKYANAD